MAKKEPTAKREKSPIAVSHIFHFFTLGNVYLAGGC
jgi:hypothetical protein